MSSDMKDTGLEQILDDHAALYAKTTMEFITDELTEEDRDKEWHHSDLKTKHAIQRLIKRETDKAYKQGWEDSMNQANVSKVVNNPIEQQQGEGR